MAGEPHPAGYVAPDLPAGQITALTDLSTLLEGYERLEAAAGSDALVRTVNERYYHLRQLLVRFSQMLARDQLGAARPLLLAIAAQAVQWAATLDRTSQR